MAGADLIDVAQAESLDKGELAEDFRAALAQIAAAYPRYSRRQVMDLTSQVFGATLGQLLFKYEPLGGEVYSEGENRLRCLEYVVAAVAGNSAFRNQREEARCAAIVLGCFKQTYDEMVEGFFQTGGRA